MRASCTLVEVQLCNREDRACMWCRRFEHYSYNVPSISRTMFLSVRELLRSHVQIVRNNFQHGYPTSYLQSAAVRASSGQSGLVAFAAIGNYKAKRKEDHARIRQPTTPIFNQRMMLCLCSSWHLVP